MPQPRGPQSGEKKPNVDKSKQGPNIDQEAPKEARARPDGKVRYASPEEESRENAINRPKDNPNQGHIGQHRKADQHGNKK